jgi:hypothetical protein
MVTIISSAQCGPLEVLIRVGYENCAGPSLILHNSITIVSSNRVYTYTFLFFRLTYKIVCVFDAALSRASQGRS